MKKILLLSNMYPSDEYPSYGVFVRNFEKQLYEESVPYDKLVLRKKSSKVSRLFAYFIYFCRVFLTLLFKKYDIIYIHYASITSIPVLLAMRVKRLNIYTNVHGTDVVPTTEKEKKLEKNTKKICEVSSKIIVPSQFFKTLILKKYNVKEDHIIVYPSGGIDEKVFFPLQDDSKKGDAFVIGFASRVEYEKGWETFISAVSNVLKETDIKPIKVIMIGEGSEKNKLEQKIKKLNLEKHVTTYGLVSQNHLNRLFNSMDVFVFPSRKESLGLVAIEALSCGTPVIASNIRPMSDYITPGQNGMLFELDNVESLTSQLTKIMNLKHDEILKMKNNAILSSSKYNTTSQKEILRQIFNSSDRAGS